MSADGLDNTEYAVVDKVAVDGKNVEFPDKEAICVFPALGNPPKRQREENPNPIRVGQSGGQAAQIDALTAQLDAMTRKNDEQTVQIVALKLELATAAKDSEAMKRQISHFEDRYHQGFTQLGMGRSRSRYTKL